MRRWLTPTPFAPALVLAAMAWGAALVAFLLLGPGLGAWADTLLTACFGWSAETRRPTLVVGLVVSPEELERRIRERARAMFDAGVVDEVRRALEQPLSRTVEKALGLGEIAALPADDALEALVTRTRRYARYQQKWMRRIPGVVLVDAERDVEAIADDIVARAAERT